MFWARKAGDPLAKLLSIHRGHAGRVRHQERDNLVQNPNDVAVLVFWGWRARRVLADGFAGLIVGQALYVGQSARRR
jgi:hypothetical protein